MEDIGENLIWDILSRLDFKTIIYCKCVCKKWRDLVVDPYFVNDLWSKKNQSLIIHGIEYKGFVSGDRQGSLNWVDVQEDDNDYQVDHVTSLNLSANRRIFPKSQMLNVGSVNGLICMLHPSDVISSHDSYNADAPYIFNPVFDEYMTLPKPQFVSRRYHLLHYGFGVSIVGEEHKVIRICRKRNNTYSIVPRTNPIEVYALGTDHWRTLGQVPYSFTKKFPALHCPSIFFHGHVHWLFCDGHIYAFDLDNETFHLFPSLPAITVGDDNHKILGVLNEGTWDQRLLI